VTSIGRFAFAYCINLNDVAIPPSVTFIGECTFLDCYSLTEVTIPASVSLIDNEAFCYCTSLTTLAFESAAPPLFGSNVFYGASSVSRLLVPTGSEDEYLAALAAAGLNLTGVTVITTFTVTFDANGGSVEPASRQLYTGALYGELPTPHRPGYRFDGWYTARTGGAAVTATTAVTRTDAHTLYAHWTKTETETPAAETKPAVGPGGAVTLPSEPTAQKPLDISKIPSAALAVSDKVWTGKQIKSGFRIVFTYRIGNTTQRKTLVAGTDYTLSKPAANRNIGKGSIAITGKGRYKGAKTIAFNIVPKAPSKLKLTSGKRTLKARFTKPGKFAAQKLSGYEVQYSYRKGAVWTAWKTKTLKLSYKKKAKSVTTKVSKLKSKKKYRVRVRAYKKSGAARYYSAWTPAKTKKVK
jgi:uncharacterized repeat protein (TIGR02543 family)